MTSTTKGFIPPRMTTLQRDAISSPVQGLTIYNTTTKCINYYEPSAWFELCGVCPVPSAAGSITGSIGPDFGVPETYSIASVSGATSYNWVVSGNSNYTIHSGQGTTSCTISFAAFDIFTVSVTPSNACGLGTASQKDVNIEFEF